MIENRLISGLPIDLMTYNLGIIHQPTLKELIMLPFKDDEFLLPFILIEKQFKIFEESEELKNETFSRMDTLYPIEQMSISVIEDEKKQDIQKHYNNPFITNKKYYTLLEIFFNVLALLYQVKVEEIEIITENNEISIMIDKNIIIDKNNIETFIYVLFKMFDVDIEKVRNLETKEDEWVEHTGTEYEKKLIEKFKKKKQKRDKEKVLHMCDYIHYVVTENNKEYKDVIDWTYFQLMAFYSASLNLERCRFEQRAFFVEGIDLKLEDLYDWKKESKFKIDESIF